MNYIDVHSLLRDLIYHIFFSFLCYTNSYCCIRPKERMGKAS